MSLDINNDLDPIARSLKNVLVHWSEENNVTLLDRLNEHIEKSLNGDINSLQILLEKAFSVGVNSEAESSSLDDL